jgi:hypothetical protein
MGVIKFRERILPQIKQIHWMGEGGGETAPRAGALIMQGKFVKYNSN